MAIKNEATKIMVAEVRILKKVPLSMDFGVRIDGQASAMHHTIVNAVMENKDNCEPTVLITPKVEHVELVDHSA